MCMAQAELPLALFMFGNMTNGVLQQGHAMHTFNAKKHSNGMLVTDTTYRKHEPMPVQIGAS